MIEDCDINAEFDDLEQVDGVSCLDVNNNVDLKTIEPGDFVHVDMIPVKKIKCIIPVKLLKNIRSIEKCVNRKLNSTPEFSIFIHGEFDLDGNFVVADKFYIPKQTVGAASVEYLEEPDEYYNGCLHKHPDGCKSFSATDDKYINSNFQFSLLYVCKNIHKGILNLNYYSNYRLQTDLNICVVDDDENIEINIDNINKPKPVVKNVITTPQLMNSEIPMPHVVQPPHNMFNDPEKSEQSKFGDIVTDHYELFPFF